MESPAGRPELLPREAGLKLSLQHSGDVCVCVEMAEEDGREARPGQQSGPDGSAGGKTKWVSWCPSTVEQRRKD